MGKLRADGSSHLRRKKADDDVDEERGVDESSSESEGEGLWGGGGKGHKGGGTTLFLQVLAAAALLCVGFAVPQIIAAIQGAMDAKPVNQPRPPPATLAPKISLPAVNSGGGGGNFAVLPMTTPAISGDAILFEENSGPAKEQRVVEEVGREAVMKAVRELVEEGKAFPTPTAGMELEEMDDRITFYRAWDGGSCHDACIAATPAGGPEQPCAADWFTLLNFCSVLKVAFPDAGDCIEHYYGRDLPAFSLTVGGMAKGGHVLVNSRMGQYMTGCDAQGDHSRRFCACRQKKSLPTHQTFHDRVARVALSQMREKRDALRRGTILIGKINEWWAAHKPADLMEDVREKRVSFLAAELGQNCHDACQGVGLSCQRHWFDVLNNCDALKAGFPEQHSCSTAFYGRDLPAYRPEDFTALVNQQPRTYSASCGGRHAKTRRLCGCGFMKGGSTSSRTFHTVYNVQASRYFEWQVRYMKLWFEQAAVPGRLTRLLSANEPDFLAISGEVPTHTSAPYKHAGGDFYTPYNKPWAVDRWLKETKPTEDIIMIVDPDCMFVKKMDIVVEEGSPVAQQAFYNFDFEKNDVPMQVARRYCNNCTFLDPIAVPIIIHRHDIMKIAPKWLEKTIEIRKDMHTWPNAWTNRSVSPVGLSWTAEMFGYVFAASELGIRHEIWDLQNVPPVHKELFTSIIHYHVEVPLPDGTQWWKHSDNAGYNIPWPLPKGTDQLTTLLLSKLHEAYLKLGKTNHTWHTPNQYVAEV